MSNDVVADVVFILEVGIECSFPQTGPFRDIGNGRMVDPVGREQIKSCAHQSIFFDSFVLCCFSVRPHIFIEI